jgi:hypothetical protein
MEHKPLLMMLFLALLLNGFASVAQAQGRWQTLGRREVDFRRDHDRVEVGTRAGSFKQLNIRVEGAPIELYDMVVTFGNGRTFKPVLRHGFAEGSMSRVIDLPGERRSIKQVDFFYRSLGHRRGRATIMLSGR